MTLTRDQQDILGFIHVTLTQTGMPPTLREIAAHFNLASINGVRQHLRLIEKKGYIRRLPRRARAIEILKLPPFLEAVQAANEVPLLGAIAAGQPITAIENREASLTLDPALFPGRGLIALRVKGNSMTGVGIYDGDIAILSPETDPRSGDIAAFLIDGEATLKRLIRETQHIRLQAENPDYPDIPLCREQDIRCIGKLKGVIRTC